MASLWRRSPSSRLNAEHLIPYPSRPAVEAFTREFFEAPAGLTNYVLDAAPASYSVGGFSASLLVPLANYLLFAEPSLVGIEYVHTSSGEVVVTSAGDPVTVYSAVNGFKLLGIDSNLNYKRLIKADPGVFTLDGLAATLELATLQTYEPGSYLITGLAAALLKKSKGVSDPASYSITGFSTTEVRAYRIDANTGSYTYAGAAATTLIRKLLSANTGVYSISGVASSTIKNSICVSYPTTYVMTGVDPSLLVKRKVIGDTGSYSLSGLPSFSYNAYRLVSSPSSYTIGTFDSTVKATRNLILNQGIYTYYGYDTSNPSTAYPLPIYVLEGIVYGDSGQYTGTLKAVDYSFKYDIETDRFVKILSNKLVMSL